MVPPLRRDLIVTRQKFEGRTYYVVKDPISLQYFRLTEEDYHLANLFDGKRTIAQVRALYIESYPHLRLDYSLEEITARIQRFAGDLGLLQFLVIQGQRLKQRYEAKRTQKKQKNGFYNFVNNVFFARFSVYDPDALFGRMAKPLWWIWTKSCMWVSIVIMVLAVLVFLRNANTTEAMMAQFFSLNNLALIWVTTIIIKSIHELGHGLTCKHFGGEVHEVGMMFLVFTPYFFVNVSDSWVMPDRRHRMLVSAAGIYVELILASFATFLWAIVQPGQFQQMLYNVMIISSVSTIFFNANPLMRFDGYYIMTDLLEIPNLQGKSRGFMAHQVKRLLFGKMAQDPVMARMPLPKQRFALFYFYAIASYIYGYFVIYKLTRYMAPHLAPFGLEELSLWFSGCALLAWVLMPFVSFFKNLNLTRDDWKPGGRLRRLVWIGGPVLLAFALLCCFPRQLVIRRAVAITLAEPETIRPEIEGIVEEVYVKEGDKVAPNAPLALLRNNAVQQNFESSKHRAKIGEVWVNRALGLDRPSELRAAETSKVQFDKQWEESKRYKDRLVLRSAKGGTILTHDLASKVGHYLKIGELFCEVAPLDQMRIKVPLSENQVRYVKKGQPVRIKSYAYPERVFDGVIADDPVTMPLGKDMPPAFSSKRHGDVPTALDREGHEVPLERTFQAEIVVNNKEGLLRQGMTGRAQINTGKRLFGKLVLQSLLDLVSLDYRF